MRQFEFTEEERRVRAHERFHHPNPRVQRRLEMRWLQYHGETPERYSRRRVRIHASTGLDELQPVLKFAPFLPLGSLIGRQRARLVQFEELTGSPLRGGRGAIVGRCPEDCFHEPTGRSSRGMLLRQLA